jgi:enoyl-[acyl-carrier protein] reductase I
MLLHGQKGLIVGIANEHSIAFGCADAFHRAGAELAITYLTMHAAVTSSVSEPAAVRER